MDLKDEIGHLLLLMDNGYYTRSETLTKIMSLLAENTGGVSSDSSDSLAFDTVLGNGMQAVETDNDSESLVGGTLGKRTYIEKTTPCPNCGSTEIYEENDLIRCTGCECQRGCL